MEWKYFYTIFSFSLFSSNFNRQVDLFSFWIKSFFCAVFLLKTLCIFIYFLLAFPFTKKNFFFLLNLFKREQNYVYNISAARIKSINILNFIILLIECQNFFSPPVQFLLLLVCCFLLLHLHIIIQNSNVANLNLIKWFRTKYNRKKYVSFSLNDKEKLSAFFVWWNSCYIVGK